ncbi:MAG: D-isomer specific 2-hydroxyacid dehydrogenase family protein [Acidimicrobiales bacterium]
MPEPVSVPRVAVGPRAAHFATSAVTDAGGTVVEVGGDADALVWLDAADVDGLLDALDAAPGARWVQLPFAGVERVAATGIFGGGRTWTCAKGAYAEPVAEHALALALAGLRHLPERVTATSWGGPKGTSLYDAQIVILGGGGIAEKLLEQLAPFRARTTVVRRQSSPVAGATRTVTPDQLHDVLPGALVVFLALALTPETTGIIAKTELELMGPDAWLVNVARGRHVVTDDLVAALRDGAIAGAALDVTDPEPLSDGHPLWSLPNAIITPHTADTPEMVRPLLAARIRTNVERFARAEPLVGLVDTAAGY